MGRVLEPLKTAGVDGVLMSSGDGVVQRAHPILVVFIGDYPEQVLVCCCKTSDCPKCIVECNEISESEDPSPLRDLVSILSVLGELDNGPLAFAQACQEAGITPVIRPFWQDLPYDLPRNHAQHPSPTISRRNEASYRLDQGHLWFH